MQRKHTGLALSPGNIKANLSYFASLVERHTQSWVVSPTSQKGQPFSICLDDVVRVGPV